MARGRQPLVLAAISLGGMAGASARYGLDLAWPAAPGGVPWGTLAVNATGCFLIGVLMATLSGIARPHPLLRPFLGIGLLGGFTTFSTYAVQVDTLLREGRALVALGYLAGTAVIALTAGAGGWVTGRALHQFRRQLAHRDGARP